MMRVNMHLSNDSFPELINRTLMGERIIVLVPTPARGNQKTNMLELSQLMMGRTNLTR